MSEPVAWVNGAIVPWSRAALPVWDLGVVAGAAVTEAGRTYGQRFLWLRMHSDRFCRAIQTLGFPLPWTQADLEAAALDVIAENVRGCGPAEDLGVVLCSTAGANATYLGHRSEQVTTIVHTYPLPFSMWKPAFEQGVRLRIPAVRQIPADCFPVELKVRNRLHWWLADQQADRLERGSRALLLDHDDCLTETSTSCVYVIVQGRILTPAANVLQSLSSVIVERLAGELRIPFERRRIPRDLLSEADEVFLSSSPSCLWPVSTIDGQACGQEVGGPIFRRLLQAWGRETGVDLERQMLSAGRG